jgi:hypothetical protein
MAERQMAGNIQSMERQGEVYSRGLKKEQAETLLGMEQQRYAAAKGQEGMARQAQMDAITGGLTGAMDMFAGFGQEQGGDFDYKSAYEKLAAAQNNNNDN